MSHMTAMIAASVLLSFATMTSHAVVAMIAVKTYEKASEQSLTEPEMTLSTQSVTHCAFKCRQYSHCTVFAYDHQLSLCLLRSAMSATKGSANISTDNPLSVYKYTAVRVPDQVIIYTGRHCPDDLLNISHGSVTIQRSLRSVEGNVTCDDDYLLLQTATSAVTCLNDGRWTSINAQCVKRVWRYPETKKIYNTIPFPIPGTVGESWSLCVEGVPTNNTTTAVDIYNGSDINRPVHTSWRFTGYLVVNDMVNGSWGTEEDVRSPPFPLLVGKPFFLRLSMSNSTTVEIYMDNVFFNRHYLKFPPSSFSHISIYGGVNVTKVETWCKQ